MAVKTPHNSANKKDIANKVIMCGDPLRSKFIAENFLEDAMLVNNVRGIQGYTGKYKNKKITVMAHGMGNPSMGIYSHELFNFYDVDCIIRVGSIGAMREEINLRDIIIATRSFTKTNYDNFDDEHGEGFIDASGELVDKAIAKAKELNLNYFVGPVYCSDNFYTSENQLELANEYNLLGVEMESAALYIEANKANKKALTICTVSDNLVTNKQTSSEERQEGFTNMMKLALEMI